MHSVAGRKRLLSKRDLTMFPALVGAAFVIVVVGMRHWSHLHAKDMGTMSQQWLAEYNAQNP